MARELSLPFKANQYFFLDWIHTKLIPYNSALVLPQDVVLVLPTPFLPCLLLLSNLVACATSNSLSLQKSLILT